MLILEDVQFLVSESIQSSSLFEFIKIPTQLILRKNHVNGEEIACFIHAHTARLLNFRGESVVEKIKRSLGCQQAFAFGASLLNGASSLNALLMAAAFLSAEASASKILMLIGEDPFPLLRDSLPKGTVVGSGVACVLMGRGKAGATFLSLQVKSMAITKEWFEERYIATLADVIKIAVEKADLDLRDVVLILPHHVPKSIWLKVAILLKMPIEKIYLNNLKKYGYCMGADPFINYATARLEGALKPGDYFVMVAMGIGVSVAAVFKA